MNVSVIVVMDNQRAEWLVENYDIIIKQFFKLGLDITQFAIVDDLLGVDYKSFSSGLTIFVEDDNKKASSLLAPINHMKDCSNGIFVSPEANIVVVNQSIFESFDEFKNMLKTHLKIDYDNYCIKCFGIGKENLKKYLEEYKNSNNVFDYFINSKYGDTLVVFRFLNSINTNIKDTIVSTFVKDLKQAFYAHKDINLSDAIEEILTLRKLKISVLETFTGGYITNLLNKIDNQNIIEDSTILNSKNTIIKILGVDEKIINQYNFVSAETIYEMVTTQLNKTDAEIVIAITGIIKNDNQLQDNIFFSAIGDKNAVNVYKHKASGDKDFIIKYASNTVIFELIKKLRQNALNITNYAV